MLQSGSESGGARVNGWTLPCGQVPTSQVVLRRIMTVSIQIEPETGMAIATCSGVLRVSDAKESATALWKAPGWSGQAAVWDFREAQFDLDRADIREVADFIVRQQPATPPARVAWVTLRDLDFGLARMFKVFREDSRTDFRVFRDYDEAISWARLSRSDSA